MEEILKQASAYWVGFVLAAMGALVTATYRKLTKQYKKMQGENKAQSDGVRALLYDRIVQMHNHYLDKGYCPIYARKSLEEMYLSYKDLGGNGVITQLHDRLGNLPTDKSNEQNEEEK